MQITKTIRAYVEETIRNKYSAAREAYKADYKTEQEKVIEEIKEKIAEFEKEIKVFALERGFEFVVCGYTYNREWRCSPADKIIDLYTRPVKADQEKEIDDFDGKIGDRWKAKARQVLFDLEVGSAKKAELADILDSVTVDVDE